MRTFHKSSLHLINKQQFCTNQSMCKVIHKCLFNAHIKGRSQWYVAYKTLYMDRSRVVEFLLQSENKQKSCQIMLQWGQHKYMYGTYACYLYNIVYPILVCPALPAS